MVDVLTPDQRRLNMSRIRNKDTAPEMVLRRGLHKRGLRFRLHRRDLPGCPDLVFPYFRAVIFVNGCFWHGHDCPKFVLPMTRTEFWAAKITKNRSRDASALEELSARGWRTRVIWECALRGTHNQAVEELLDTVIEWLRQTSNS
jgi:DNA mismatch endonuclease (patch repair protein)